jgi:hypothetical protein
MGDAVMAAGAQPEPAATPARGLPGSTLPVPAELRRRVGRLEQVAGVRLVTLGDGAERGVRVLEFRTAAGFSFEVHVDRCFDLGRCALRGQPLAWESPVGVAGPWYREVDGLGFFRTFAGGLLTTCGLDHALFMATDSAAHYAYPPKPAEAFGLHGRASTLPARLAGYGLDAAAGTLWAEGEVTQAAVFGERLVLRRRIEAAIDGTSLTLHDEVVNEGFAATPHMLLYHVNAGWPVLDEGAELFVPARAVHARGDHPLDGYATMTAPQRGFVEQVFEHELLAEEDGTVPVALVNRARGLGLFQRFSRHQLPHCFCWRMLGEGTYVVGIEPSTNRAAGRLDARERGELIVLEPGARRAYDLELGALDGVEQIDRFTKRVESLR